jgi:hypothetical protein
MRRKVILMDKIREDYKFLTIFYFKAYETIDEFKLVTKRKL